MLSIPRRREVARTTPPPVLAAVLALASTTALPAADDVHGPLPVERAVRHFELHPALEIEIVAAEPQVVDPVALAFDEHGRLWVAEMRDYPNGPAPGESPKSRIKLLEDRDGDGRYETAHVFADNLLFANGVQPWRGGVIVTMSGEVAWMADTDGDHRADVRETWFAGFAEQNPQLRANHPTFALDNHVYVANGLRGGKVIAKKKEWADEAEPVSISGMDFRFDPIGGRYEAVSGVGQFGLTFDDWGNRFVCSNRNPCKHVVLEDRYLGRNPHLAVPSVYHDVSPAGEESRVYPVSRAWTTSTLHQGQFTAACGVTIYRGHLLPEEFYGNSFTCEPTGYLVHRDVLRPQGATFTSRPGREKVEFLASRDEWFRPVNLAHGPDGALYVVDMYRAVIEHPQFMPEELKRRPDLYEGNDRGRIYRIVPKSPRAAPREIPPSAAGGHLQSAAGGLLQGAVGGLSTAELVPLLEHPGAWHRETAARLIYERQDRSTRRALERTVARSHRAAHPARAQALWLLEGLGVLDREVVLAALHDPHPRVREQAVRLSERWLKQSAPLRQRVLELADDADARVRFQAALSLGESSNEESMTIPAALAEIAYRDSSDVWTRAAVASSSAGIEAGVLKSVYRRAAANNGWRKTGLLQTVGKLAEIVGSRREPTAIRAALFPLADQPASRRRQPADAEPEATERPSEKPALSSPEEAQLGRFALIDGLGRGTRRRGKPLGTFLKGLPDDERQQIQQDFEKAAALAVSRDAETADRLLALSVLGHADYAIAGPALKQLATGEGGRRLRLAAIDALADFSDPQIGAVLLEGFTSRTPAVRRAIVDALLSDPARTEMLLDEIEAGRFSPVELDPSRRNRLTRHGNEPIRERAAKLLAAAVPADRRDVIDDYRKALDLKADPEQGRTVFEKNCAACHRIGKLGVDVAPDIADSRTRKPAQLLVDILDPNRAVDSNYFSYTVVTADGNVHTGLVAAETANSVTLRQQEGKTVTVLRQDILEMHSTGVSLMPVGVEKNVTPQQMADLISFIKNWRYLDGRVPIDVGN